MSMILACVYYQILTWVNLRIPLSPPLKINGLREMLLAGALTTGFHLLPLASFDLDTPPNNSKESLCTCAHHGAQEYFALIGVWPKGDDSVTHSESQLSNQVLKVNLE